MRKSRRAMRMEQKHSRRGHAQLNLVALMDIFTILVFFLLVNSSNVQSPDRGLTLPEARTETVPRETLVVKLDGRSILVQDRKVATIADVLGETGPLIADLKNELDYQARRSPVPAGEREVTVLGDRTIPYQLLKRVMLTLSESGYARISLAVNRKEKKAS